MKSLHSMATEIFHLMNPATSSHFYTVTPQQGVTGRLNMAEDSDLVGGDTAKTDLIKLLRLHEFEDPGLSTITVTGMTGLGKTAIVGNVYNDALVRDFFPIRAWLSLSQSYNYENILKTMFKQFMETAQVSEPSFLNSNSEYIGTTNGLDYWINSMEVGSLEHRVKKYLAGKRFIVVFDDVQDANTRLATDIKSVLPVDNNKGSKLVITTRYGNVARTWIDGSNHGLYKLVPLPYQEAWKLFCKRTFRNGGICPLNLERVASAIVSTCEGIPLIVSEIGRFLSTRLDDIQEWEIISQGLGYYLQQNLTEIFKHFMCSSYHDLSHHLQSCFLYFGLFPKGYFIGKERLIRLWIAEGFIQLGRQGGSGDLTTLEDIAENYLKQLVDMNLIEEYKDNTGKSRALRVCGFLHEIILPKMNELGFCQTRSDKNEVKPRHISIYLNPSSFNTDYHQIVHSIISNKSSIRGLLYSTLAEPPRADTGLLQKVLSEAFLGNVPLLKILDLSNAPIDELPKEVGKLRNLRYLSLRNTRIKKLPSSIVKLQDLQTLDLKQTPIHELPSEINELHKLRHLLTYCYEDSPTFSPHVRKIVGTIIPPGVLKKFGELQKLAFVDLGPKGNKVVKEIRKLRQLRRLGITGLKLEQGQDLCAAIEEMRSLQTLSVYSENLSEYIHLDHFINQPPLTLKRIYLNGPLMPFFPSWIIMLPNLVKIRLRWSWLETDPLEILETLPNLVELQLLEAYGGNELHIGKEGFKKLKILNLLDLKDLETLSIDQGALPNLQLMAIGESPQLKVPFGIKFLRLDTLQFFNMPLEFNRSLQPGGQHFSVVQHVGKVTFPKV